jgi:hypothetical protein
MLQVTPQKDDGEVERQESSLLVEDHHPLARHVATTICEACTVVARLVRSTHRVVAHREIMTYADKFVHKLFGWRTMRATRLASDRWIRAVRVF